MFWQAMAQSARYALEKKVSKIQLIQHPSVKNLGNLRLWDRDGDEMSQVPVENEEHLASLIGKDAAQKLLSDDDRTLEGDDLKMGGRGMKGFYDDRIPKSMLRLARMHDPNASMGDPVSFRSETGDTYQGWHMPLSDEAKQSILKEGFPAMRRGGRVDVDRALNLTRSFTKEL